MLRFFVFCFWFFFFFFNDTATTEIYTLSLHDALPISLTFGLLTPFYFIRAGAYVSVQALVSGFGVLIVLLAAKMATKFVGVYPITKFFKSPPKEAMYTTLLMSTGLTFGSISALFGLTHRIITQQQYSYLIAAVIGSAIVPTLIANAFFLPRHLVQNADVQDR